MPLYRGGGCLGGSGGSFEEEGEAVEGVDGFAVGRGLYLALAGADGLNGVYKFGEDGRLRYRNVVRAENEFELGFERGDFLDGGDVGVEVGFRAIQPDGSGIVGVAGEEEAVFAVEQADGVWRVTRRRDDF